MKQCVTGQKALWQLWRTNGSLRLLWPWCPEAVLCVRTLERGTEGQWGRGGCLGERGVPAAVLWVTSHVRSKRAVSPQVWKPGPQNPLWKAAVNLKHRRKSQRRWERVCLGCAEPHAAAPSRPLAAGQAVIFPFAVVHKGIQENNWVQWGPSRSGGVRACGEQSPGHGTLPGPGAVVGPGASLGPRPAWSALREPPLEGCFSHPSRHNGISPGKQKETSQPYFGVGVRGVRCRRVYWCKSCGFSKCPDSRGHTPPAHAAAAPWRWWRGFPLWEDECTAVLQGTFVAGPAWEAVLNELL